MQICVYGLWHLGCVTAACVAENFATVGLDPNPAVIADLQAGKTPVFEPGLWELIEAGVSAGRLRFTDDLSVIAVSDIVWVTFDTPVNEDDVADVEYVERMVAALFPHLKQDATVLISSQLPVGTTSRLAAQFRERRPRASVEFAYCPENLRLGKAITVFRNQERIIAGVQADASEQLKKVLSAITSNVISMSVESAEMTKHALNAFLANSIVFMNEVAALCEQVGADAKQVEQGLKTEERIGPRAYLRAGGAFAGGTLARDVAFLNAKAEGLGVSTPMLQSIRASNEWHKGWADRKLGALLEVIEGKTIAVLGLTYKPGTDTLRRSAAIDLCRRLRERKAVVRAFDPAVKRLPDELSAQLVLCASAAEALDKADAAVVATEWPEFRELTSDDFATRMRTCIVLDANRFLDAALQGCPGIRYVTVGAGKTTE